MIRVALRMTAGVVILTLSVVSGLSCSGRSDEVKSISIFLMPSPAARAIQSFIPAFELATGTKVHVTETPSGNAHQKLLLASQQGAGVYDVAQFDNYFLATYGAADVMTPLDDYLSDSVAYDIDDFSEGQKEYGKYKGKTLGLTLSTEPMIQWYRTDIYDKLGLKPATTWEEYKANAIAVQESGLGDGVLLGWGPRVTWWWMTLVWSFGGHLYNDRLVPTLDTPEVVEATTYLKELTAYGPEGGLSTDGDGVTNKFLSQDIGSMIQYSGYYAMTLDASNNRYAGLIGTAPMPMGSVDVTHLAGWNIGIPSDSKQKDLAWQFLEYVLGKENAKAYLLSGASAVGRISITEDPELLTEQPYLRHLNIPKSSRIEPYPQIRVWPEFEKAITDVLARILAGTVEVREGLETLQANVIPILAQERQQ